MPLGTTNTILKAEASLKEVKRHILKVDWETCLSTASQHGSTAIAANISSSASWMKHWDMALDHGPHGITALQALYSMLTRPRFCQSISSTCETESEETYFEHYTILIHSPELVIEQTRAQKSLNCTALFVCLYIYLCYAGLYAITKL